MHCFCVLCTVAAFPVLASDLQHLIHSGKLGMQRQSKVKVAHPVLSYQYVHVLAAFRDNSKGQIHAETVGQLVPWSKVINDAFVKEILMLCY